MSLSNVSWLPAIGFHGMSANSESGFTLDCYGPLTPGDADYQVGARAGVDIRRVLSRDVVDAITEDSRMPVPTGFALTYLLTLIVSFGLPDYLKLAIKQGIGGLACCGRTLRSVGCADEWILWDGSC